MNVRTFIPQDMTLFVLKGMMTRRTLMTKPKMMTRKGVVMEKRGKGREA
jgi:hypothetical protein